MIRWSIAACVALLAPLPAFAQVPAPPEDAKCFEIRDWKDTKPSKEVRPFKPTVYVPGPEGPVPFEARQIWSRCEHDKRKQHYLSYILLDQTNKRVIPGNYKRVAAITADTFAMTTEDDRSYYWKNGQKIDPPAQPQRTGRVMRTLNQGQNGVCPATGIAPLVYMSTWWDDPKTVHHLEMRYGDKISWIPNVGVPRRYNDIVFVPRLMSLPSRELSTQIFDLYGNPVSGILGEISYWYTHKPKDWGMCYNMGNPDALTKGPSLDRDPSNPHVGPAYFPIGLDGGFLTMPQAAIGVFPLRRQEWKVAQTYAQNSDEIEYLNDLWAIAYPDPQGWSFSVHSGRVSEAVATATGQEPRYRNLWFDGSGMFAAQSVTDGRWNAFTPGYDVGSFQRIELAGGFPSGQAAVAKAQADIAAHRAALAAEYAARKAKEDAEALARSRQFFAEVQSKGNLCMYSPALAMPLGPDAIATFARSCPEKFSQDDLAKAQAAGISAETVGVIRQGQNRLAARQYQEQLDREENMRNPPQRPYVPGAWSDAIHAYGNQLVRDINTRSENWMEQRQKAYREEYQRKQRAY